MYSIAEMARRGYKKMFVLGCLFSCCLLTALVVVVFAALLWTLSPSLVRSQVNQRMTILEGHATYEQLRNPMLPAWKSFYFFNLTNPEEFEQNGTKPILEEIGPYSYREYRRKQFIKFSPDQEFLEYNQTKVFYFDPAASGQGLAESDIICTINIPFISGADLVAGNPCPADVEYFEGYIRQLGAHIYVCQNATALAWNYTDSLIQWLHALQQYPHTSVSIQVNNSINDSYPSIIRTGVGDINLIGRFIQWNGHEGRLNTWRPPDSMCNMFSGTEGIFFHPNLKEGENLVAFVDDLQRLVDLVYVGKVNHLGLEAFRYELANYTFYNVSRYPDNACWGPYKSGAKTPQGLFYIGPTQYPEIPLYASYPHFYDGDPCLLDCIEGLHPTSDKIVKIDVEPITGAGIQFQKNLQLSIKVTKYDILYLRNIQCVDKNESFYYPVLWLSEHAELTPEFKQYLEDKGLNNMKILYTLASVVFGILLVIEVVLLSISCSMCCCCLYHTSSKEEGKRPLIHYNNNRLIRGSISPGQ